MDKSCFHRPVIRIRHFHRRFGGIDIGLLRLDIRGRLDTFQPQQHVALLDLVALLHHNFPDLFAENVGVGFRANFTRPGYERRQILSARHCARLHCDHALVRLVHAESDDAPRTIAPPAPVPLPSILLTLPAIGGRARISGMRNARFFGTYIESNRSERSKRLHSPKRLHLVPILKFV